MQNASVTTSPLMVRSRSLSLCNEQLWLISSRMGRGWHRARPAGHAPAAGRAVTFCISSCAAQVQCDMSRMTSSPISS